MYSEEPGVSKSNVVSSPSPNNLAFTTNLVYLPSLSSAPLMKTDVPTATGDEPDSVAGLALLAKLEPDNVVGLNK